MSQALFAKGCRFLATVTSLQTLPLPNLPEIAFAGRSNVGKSSLINALVCCHGLARVSQLPGRTQALILFSLAERALLVDLPGYGFAHAPGHVRNSWQRLADSYLAQRKGLTLLLIDARRGLGDQDRAFINQLDRIGRSYHLVITKADKLLPAAAKARKEELAQFIRHKDQQAALSRISLTSARSQQGLKELRCQLANWIRTDKP